eukprot:TRINITY_DN1016_c4_g1_i1.p1 TRINITY_DN1016_c4_g1~~TRINITY_DN1016_c4_g1_i1.p1  ORF type:complete len:1070 (+),score=240.32 TRINITY_DN1016_c4_g1_i1:43-3210(+)
MTAMADCAVNIGTMRKSELEKILENAKRHNVDSVLLIGGNAQKSKACLELARDETLVKIGVKMVCCAGVHPTESLSWNDSTEQTLISCLSDPLCVAVGECGLSYVKDAPPQEVQKWVFSRQVSLAQKLSLPIFAHQRGHSQHDLLSTLTPEMYPSTVIHCFTGSLETLRTYLTSGCCVSFSGWLALKDKGFPLRHSLSKIPIASYLKQILLETDTPFLKPDLYDTDVKCSEKKESSEPADVVLVAKCFSEVSGLSEQEVRKATHDNFWRMFGRKGGHGHGTVVRVQHGSGKKKKNYSSDAPKFIVPHTLARLAKQMRGVGIDTIMMNTNGVAKLLEAATTENRIILLRHAKSISTERLDTTKWLKLSSDHTREQVAQVLSTYNLYPNESDLQKRCVVCNACKWHRETHSNARSEIGDIAANHKIFRCGGCRKLYWEGGIFRKAQKHFRALYIDKKEGTEENEESPVSPPPCKERCKKQGAAKNLSKKEVHLLFIHNRYGVVLFEALGKSTAGAKWEIAKTHVLELGDRPYSRKPEVDPASEVNWDEAVMQAVKRLARVYLGLEVKRSQVRPAIDSETGEEIVKGRRTYFVVQLFDSDSAPKGTDGARPPLSGEDFWLRSSCPFTFVANLNDASGMVKRSMPGSAGKVDVVGSAVLKWMSLRIFTKKIANIPRTAAPVVLDASSELLNFTAATAHGEYITSIAQVTTKLRSKGVAHPDHTRALWDWRPRHLGGSYVPSVEKYLEKDDPPPDPSAGMLTPMRLWRWFNTNITPHEGAILAKVKAIQKQVQSVVGEVVVFGSTATGVADKDSYDVDMQVVGAWDEENEKQHLMELADKLQASDIFEVGEITPVLSARVPVLKTFVGTVPVDFTLRCEGCFNSKLFRAYFEQKPFVRPLAYVVKRWGAWSGVKSRTVGWFTSYSLQLLLIYSLLHSGSVVFEPLEKTVPVIDSYSDVTGVTDAQVGTALGYFFWYYGWKHDWDNDVVCIMSPVQKGVPLTKAELGWEDAPAAVRDPFEQDLNLTRRSKDKILTDISRRFRLSYSALESGGLQSLFSDTG